MDSTQGPLRQGAMSNEERINGQDEDERCCILPSKVSTEWFTHECVLKVVRVHEKL